MNITTLGLVEQAARAWFRLAHRTSVELGRDGGDYVLSLTHAIPGGYVSGEVRNPRVRTVLRVGDTVARLTRDGFQFGPAVRTALALTPGVVIDYTRGPGR